MTSKEEFAALILAQPLVDAAVRLKVTYEKTITFMVDDLGFTKEDAIKFANDRINEVNSIGDDFYSMKREGKSDDDIRRIFHERVDKDE